MYDGEWIILTDNVILSSDLTRTPFYNSNTKEYDASGTISITFGNYNVAGKVILSSKVTVKTDKKVSCFYTENDNLIEGIKGGDKWTYNWAEQ